MISGVDSRYIRRSVQHANRDMPTASSCALIRLLATAFLLLLGSGKDERACNREHDKGRTTKSIAAANISAAVTTTSVGNDVDPAQLQLSSEANPYDCR